MPSPFTLTQAKLLVGGYDLSGDLSQLAVNITSEAQDASAFGPGWRQRVNGLRAVTFTAKGNVDLGSSQSDSYLFASLGTNNILATVIPNGVTLGSTNAGTGFSMQAVHSKYSPGAAVGQLLPFDYEANSQGTLARATVLNDFTVGPLSTGTNNTAFYQLPVFTTSESLYAGFHVLGLSTALAGTVSAVVQQASSSGGAGVTTRGTFSAVSCRSGSWLTPVGSALLSTDQPFWRASITVSTGTSTGAQATGLIWMAVQA